MSIRSLFLCVSVAALFTVTACSGTEDTNPESAHIQILDEIPEHIQEVENLTIYPGNSEPRYSVELIPEQNFGIGSGPWLASITDAVVNDNGHLIIWDINTEGSSFPPPNRLSVYNPDGSFLTQIGGNGRGPGEFIMLMAMNTGNDKIYALDHTSQRLNVYNGEDYSFERSTLIDQWSVHNHDEVESLGFGRLITRNDGNHLAAFIERVPVSERSPVFKFMLIGHRRKRSGLRTAGISGRLYHSPADNATQSFHDVTVYGSYDYGFISR